MPKSRNGKRTLPLDDELVAAGVAYQAGFAGLDWYQGGEYVITDELGMPVHPEWYSDEFGRLLRRGPAPDHAAGLQAHDPDALLSVSRTNFQHTA